MAPGADQQQSAAPAAVRDGAHRGGLADDAARLKELLYRAETERLEARKRAADLESAAAAAASEAAALRASLSAGAAARASAEREAAALRARVGDLEADLGVARREYRANEIIAVGLRERLAAAERRFAESQAARAAQAARLASVQSDIDALEGAKIRLTDRVARLETELSEAQSARDEAARAADEARLELGDVRARAAREADGAAAAIAARDAAAAAGAAALEAARGELRERRGELDAAACRARELESELADVRGLALLLGSAAQLQGATGLPGVDDAVWGALGALGGVQHTLDVVLGHLKAQEARVREAEAAAEQLEERLRAESGQRQALAQASRCTDLLDAQLLYAKAVGDREGLETRAAAAEEQGASAASDLEKARAQAASDAARLRELHESALALTAEVARLAPLAPKAETLEAEKASLEARCERLDEALAAAQRQLELWQARETNARAEVVGFKGELAAALEANRQLLEESQALTKRVQALEVSSREGTLAAEQLEAARRRLENAKSNMGQMAETHRRALRELESEVVRAASRPASASASARRGGESGGGSRPGSSAASSRPSGSPSRPGTAAAAGGGGGGPGGASRPGTAAGRGDSGGGGGGGRQQQGEAEGAGGSGRPAGGGEGPQGVAAALSADAAAGRAPSGHPQRRGDGGSRAGSAADNRGGAAAGGPGQPAGAGPVEPADGGGGEAGLAGGSSGEEDEGPGAWAGPAPRLPLEVAAALEAAAAAHGAPRSLRAAQERQLSALCTFAERLRRLLLKQTERSASLEVQLLKGQEAELTRQQRQQREAAEAASAEGAEQAAALAGLLAALRGLRADLAGDGGECGGDQSAGAPTAGQGGEQGASAGAAQPEARSRGGGPSSAAAAASRVVAALRAVSEQRAAAAALVAARREKGVQSDDPLAAEWRAFVAALCAPGGPPPRHPLQLRACCEAVVRIYSRALRDLEESVEQREAALALAAAQQQAQAQAQAQADAAQAQEAQAQAQQGPRGTPRRGAPLPSAQLPGSCLFDVLVAHYSQDGLAAGGDTEAWRDPQGPIARLILSCRAHFAAAPGAKLAAFLRFAGAADGGDAAAAWGVGEWRFALCLLLGVKRLVAGLWRGLLRDWASPAGAKLPLQAAHDLLANLYNCQDAAALPRRVAAALEGLSEPPAAAAAAAGGAGGQQQGPGAGVDLDGLLVVLVEEHVAGFLPLDPLLAPRRITDGSLNNVLNAWGVSASGAPAGGGNTGAAALQQQQQPPRSPASPGAARPVSSGSSAWGGGGLTSRASPLSASGGGGLLPRIKTPETPGSGSTATARGGSGGAGGGSGWLPLARGGSGQVGSRSGKSTGLRGH
ncbi:hypothetical protein Rsub_01871 [Raphidocelis subcapitata]|uniref:Uncharacterized protein n=1 Tax=Raphidocelis subcapitata TaxID=307507 RepID=A0A2V0NNL0_9CHLO|nr:hypothetical protein Rsub_01871 [Raphidocelis subcapitata]|eukprot:GBF89154.1 hypothetical protein Rsub_01871 [Raphidocelis subcapitata]